MPVKSLKELSVEPLLQYIIYILNTSVEQNIFIRDIFQYLCREREEIDNQHSPYCYEEIEKLLNFSKESGCFLFSVSAAAVQQLTDCKLLSRNFPVFGTDFPTSDVTICNFLCFCSYCCFIENHAEYLRSNINQQKVFKLMKKNNKILVMDFSSSEDCDSECDKDHYTSPPLNLEKSKAEDSLELREKTTKALRDHLDEHLVGTFSPVRKQLVKVFINDYLKKPDFSKVNLDFCLAFFDCLLDDNFTSFNNTCADETCKYFDHPLKKINSYELLKIIRKRSPYLRSLNLDFDNSLIVDPFVSNFGCILQSLEHLTRLHLEWKIYDDQQENVLPLFLSLGYCLNLTHLHLGGNLSLGTEKLLTLMFGEKRPLLPLLPQHLVQEITDSSTMIAHLEFDRNCLTPICSSLQQFKQDENHDDDSFENCAEVFAFIFRHFLRLQKWDQDLDPSVLKRAVKLLHTYQEEPCTTSQSSSAQLGTIQWTSNASFRGILYTYKTSHLCSEV